MSFFDDSSLAFLPSGAAGKDGKAYSIKPTDGTGDFTFSRGSNLAATRVGPTGLIEKGRENLLLQSNQFDTTWGSNGTLTSGQSGYDGSNDAWLFNYTTDPSIAFVSNTNSGVQTVSLYAKGSVSNGLRIYAFGSLNCQAYFDLNIGSVENTSNIISATIEDKSNGWYRCSMTFNQTNSSINFYLSNNANLNATSGSIYIQDAQLEIGLAASEVIESGATTGKAGLLEDEPRFDYSGGATCPSLLLEPSRTQLAQYSEALNIAPNVIDNANYSYNEIASPSGLIDAPKFAETTANDRHGFYQYVTTAVGAVTASVFTKQIDRRYVHFQSNLTGSALSSYVDLQDGSVVSEGTGWTLSTEDYGNGWLRISATATGIAFGAHYFIWGMSLNGTSNTYLGDGSEFTFWGFQAEQGSYPTSYIPNHSGGTITRGEDNSYTGTISGVIGQTQGVVFCEFIYRAFAEDMRMGISDGTSANYNNIRITSGGTLYVLGAASSVLQYEINAGSLTDSQTYKVALKYNTNDIEVFVNGVSKGTDTTATIGVCNRFGFDNRAAGANPFYSDIKQTLLFPTALSDADCITLTTI